MLRCVHGNTLYGSFFVIQYFATAIPLFYYNIFILFPIDISSHQVGRNLRFYAPLR